MRFPALSKLISTPAGSASNAPGRPVSSGGDAWGALMEAAQKGHGGAYQRLLGELSGWLERYFQRRLPIADIDDAVQETLMAVHRRRHTFDPRYPLSPWVAAIAKRKWIDQLRSIGRRPTDDLPDNLAVEDHESAVISASVLANLLAQLRPAQAQAIWLVKVQGYSIEDACHETGLSASAVKMNIRRGLARLTAFIETSDDLD